ncbi:MAG TPA: serine/threonine-protein kinase [Limnobacter sp.]|nr:serine/threonine-protein kinase [Limnobacter sp.]
MSAEPTVIRSSLALPTDAGQEPLQAGTRIEEFEIESVIGVGGFGIVYRAMDHQLERPVALKEYLPAALAVRHAHGQVKVRDPRHEATFKAGMRSFINEAKMLAQFDHPALVKVYRFWENAGTAYMVMPLYQGDTLQAMREKMAQAMPQSMLLDLLIPLTEALEVLHAQHCYHRDVSPENILLLNGSGKPVLLDFGAARRAIGNVSQPFTVILKASYAPIEQYAEAPGMVQGPWTDVYALAAVAHYLMVGKTPPSSVARMVNDNYQTLASRDDLPYDLPIRQAVDAALAVQAHDRTQTMALFRQNLQAQAAAVDILDAYANPTPPLKPDLPDRAPDLTSQPKRPRRMMIWAMLALVLTMAVLLALLLAPDWTAPPKTSANEASSTNIEQATETAKPGMAATSPTLAANSALPARFAELIQQADHAVHIQAPTEALTIGQDLLQFEVRSPIAGHLAVYVRSSDGSVLKLLPNARVPSLLVQADVPVRLPPASEPIAAAGPAGENAVLVVVTEQLRDDTALGLQDHYGFGVVTQDAPLKGASPCIETGCRDLMAAGWFIVQEKD